MFDDLFGEAKDWLDEASDTLKDAQDEASNLFEELFGDWD